MKTKIAITGQIGSIYELYSAIKTSDCEVKKGMFNSFILTFNTKKEAKKALWEGFKYLKRTLDNPTIGLSGINYSKHGSLSYDAARAKILDNN